MSRRGSNPYEEVPLSADDFIELADEALEPDESSPGLNHVRPPDHRVRPDPAAQTQLPEPGGAGAYTYDPDTGELQNYAEVDPTPLADEATRIETGYGGGGLEPAPAAPPGPRLLCIGGNDRNKEFAIVGNGDTSIGRGIDNNVVIGDIAVSRKHTLICAEGGGYVLRDLGSGNGTLVNGQRARSVMLRDGDQIEVGNTLLRFVDPMTAGAMAGATANLSYANTAAAPAPTMDVRRLTPPSAKRPASPAKRRKKLLLFGSVAVLFLLGGMIGLKAWMNKRGAGAAAAVATGPALNADELAAEQFEQGTKEYRNRNWEKARQHYLKVLAVAPGFDQAKRYADQATAEMNARDAVQRAKNSLAALDFNTARIELSRVASTSVYSAEARKLKQRTDDEQVQSLVTSARRLDDAGDNEGALAKVDEAQRIAPSNSAVRAMHEKLRDGSSTRRRVRIRSKPRKRRRARATRRTKRRASRRGTSDPLLAAARGEPSRRRSSAPAPKVRGGAKTGIGLYRNKQWGPAYESLKAHAASQRGRRKSSALKMAESVRRVGQAVIRARAAQSRKPAVAVRYYKQALAEDRKVARGQHQAYIKTQLFRVSKLWAIQAMAANNSVSAYKAVKLAKQYGKSDRAITRIVGDLERKASALFTKGYTLRSANPSKARKLWKQVLRMVPPTATVYQKAYSWLNNTSSQPSVDEDED